MTTKQTAAPELVLTHEFNAPKQLVFEAFSNAAALTQWWGPAGYKNAVVSFEFKKGGLFHYKMENNGQINYGRCIFGNIQPFDLLEYTISFADEKANPIKAPFDIQLPIEIFYTLLFTEKNGKTTISLTGKAVNPTREQMEGFNAINSNMQEGTKAMFDILTIYLDKIQRAR